MYNILNLIIDIIAALIYLACIYEYTSSKDRWVRYIILLISLYIFYKAGDYKLLLVPIAFLVVLFSGGDNNSDSSSSNNENTNNNSEDVYSQQNQSLNNNNRVTPSKKYYDINTATKQELMNLKILDLYTVNKILSLRNKGVIFESYDHLQKEAHINNQKLEELKKVTVINYVKPNQTSEENYPIIKKVNFNKDSKEKLMKIKGLTSNDVNDIIILRKNGVTFNSFEDLEEKAGINSTRINILKKNIEIIPDNSENVTNKEITLEELDDIIADSKTQNQNETPKKQTESEKIDINNANQETLTKIPSINIIKAKKILDLREQGNYIKSYEDLQQKLNLKPEQIKQIKQTTTITKPEKENLQGRIMDI